MKRWLIGVISTVFVFAAAALIAIQIWQMQRSVAISDSLFNTSVTNAMDEVIATLRNDNATPDLIYLLDFPALDSAVDQALLSAGIDIRPALGVCSTDLTEFFYTSEPNIEHRLSESPYKYSFSLSSDPAEETYYIVLHFSDRALFLLRNSNLYIYMSILLISIIAVSYIVTARLLRNQRKVDEMKSNFINNMTHELKTPITTIRLEAAFLSECPDLSADERQQHLQVITAENERMLSVVEAVLRNSRMARKRFALRFSEVDANQLLSREIERAQPRLHKAGGSSTLRLDADPPIVVCDTDHLRNAISNLIDNAIKYSPENPHITASTYIDRNHFCIAISDNGLGISRDDLRHITEAFYRVNHGDRHDVKGFGIGLSYVQQVVRAHHGKLLIESQVGKGSTFTIQLPMQK